MPFKLILFLITIVVMAFFIGFNLDNRCDVSFVLYTFKNVPIIISLVTAYVLGSLSVLPALLGSRKKKRLAKKEKEAKNALQGKDKKNKGKNAEPSLPDYNID